MELGLATLPISAIVGCIAGGITSGAVGGCLGIVVGIGCYFAGVFPYIELQIQWEKRFIKKHGSPPNGPPRWYVITFLPLMAGIVISSAVLSWLVARWLA